MIHPDRSGGTGGEDYGLPSVPFEFVIPDTATELLEKIDGAVWSKEYEKLGQTIQEQLRSIDTSSFGGFGLDLLSYHTQYIEDGQREVLISTRAHDVVGDCWHIIVNEKTYDNGTAFLSYDEFTIPKHVLMFAFRGGQASTGVPELWSPDVLGDSAALHKKNDSYRLIRGDLNGGLLVPSGRYQPIESEQFRDFCMEMSYLTEVLGGLGPATHDDIVTGGNLY